MLLPLLLQVDRRAAQTILRLGLLTLYSAFLQDAEVVKDDATTEVLGYGHFVSIELVAAEHVQGSVSAQS